MRYGSVCSGIEAATVAWKPLGWKAAWFAEIDPFACAVLAYRYPHVPNYGDMTRLAARVLAGEIEAPDVLVGGTPCQAYSLAGLRNGLNDDRGQLTIKFMELADAIDYVRAKLGKPPCIIVWENVPGVYSDKTNAFGCFLAGLAGEDVELRPAGKRWTDAGCVYGPKRAIAWRTLDAQHFGLAQRRRRCFLVSSARDGFDPAAVLFEWDGVRRDTPPRRESGQETAGTLASRTDGGGFPGTDEACSGYIQPVASTGDISHCLNAGGMGRQDYETETETETVIVQSVALRGREGGATAELGGDLATALRCGGGGGDKPHVLAPVPLLEVGKRTGTSTTDPRAGIGIGEPGDAMYTLQAGAQHGIAYAFAENSRAELRLENGDGQITGTLSTGGGKPGQGTPCVCVTGDITHTLKADGFDGSEDGTKRGQPIVAAVADTLTSSWHNSNGATAGNNAGMINPVIQGMAVRRLTPRECERLQGFPDDYTMVPLHRKKPIDVLKFSADGPRYKALGNSMATPCMYFIGSRIDRAVKHIAALAA